MTSVLGVHGVGNYDPTATDESRAASWSASLRHGFGDGPIPAFDLAIAYYAPALHLATAQGPRNVEQLTADQADDVWEWLVASGLPQTATQGHGAKPIRQALEWFARTFDLDQRAVERLVTRFFPEVGTYLHPNQARRRAEARGIVGEAIDRHTPRIILAHSLGSVVTYEALWQNAHPEVDLLITLGSPLAMPTVVYDRLDPSPRDSPARKPPGVRRWVNVADPGDVVSILRPMTNYFDGIDQLLEPSIHVADVHFARHYLSAPAVAALIGVELSR
ncbi:MAG: hypothetical protein U0Q21_01120 [Dermatophilaceae bacterium]